MKKILCACLSLLCASIIHAQAPAITVQGKITTPSGETLGGRLHRR